MKKMLLFSTITCAFLLAHVANAETTSGKVLSVDGKTITVQTEDGQKMTMNLNDKTTYRKKKMVKTHKTKRGTKAIEWSYTPVAEEDDWIDITYNPATGTGTAYQVQDVVVYDD